MSQLTLESIAEFVWFWSDTFFLETDIGNFVWSDPDYQGDNTIRPYHGTIQDYCKETHISFGRSKGRHCIVDYCGKDVKILE